MNMTVDSVVSEFLENAEAYAAGKQITVAECPELDTEITLEGFLQGGGLYPSVTLWCGYNVLESADCYSEDELRESLAEFFELFSDPSVIGGAYKLSPDKPAEDDPPDDLPADPLDDPDPDAREDELSAAAADFLAAVYGPGYDFFAGSRDEEALLEDVKDELLSVLAGFDDNIYRPGLGWGDYPYRDDKL